MITSAEAISQLFSIFHDGTITAWHRENGTLTLQIEIPYLAERVNPAYTWFTCRLEHAATLSLETWPRDATAAPEPLHGLSAIAAGDWEILNGEARDGRITVALRQHDAALPYSGGQLAFTAAAARITDEGGQPWDLPALQRLCDVYWNAPRS